MIKLWWAQIRAVVRLEMRKVFFAKRGLWIYVLAALPVLLFGMFLVATAHQRHARALLARRGDRILSSADIRAVGPGMTREEVIKRLGKPPVVFQWAQNRPAGPGRTENVLRESLVYSDGQDQLFIELSDDKVERITISGEGNQGEDSVMFAGIFQFFFLRLAVFFGCLGVFMNLFRGEILDRSLHFYFLAPIRREVLMAGKFLAGLLATCVIFVTSELVQTAEFIWHFSPNARELYLFQHHGLEHAAVYVGVTILACVGYGAFFLVAGMLFKNPILPTAVILIWEWINPFLPAVLKQFSVIYYLKSLSPVDIPTPPGTPPLLALLVSNADPVSPLLAVLGVLGVALVALTLSSVRVRTMEINYATE